jgi:hypothetical protein
MFEKRSWTETVGEVPFLSASSCSEEKTMFTFLIKKHKSVQKVESLEFSYENGIRWFAIEVLKIPKF